MKNMDEESKSRGDELDDAFKDLDKLMKNAKEMVRRAYFKWFSSRVN